MTHYHAPQSAPIAALLAHARVVTAVLDDLHLAWRVVGGAAPGGKRRRGCGGDQCCAGGGVRCGGTRSAARSKRVFPFQRGSLDRCNCVPDDDPRL